MKKLKDKKKSYYKKKFFYTKTHKKKILYILQKDLFKQSLESNNPRFISCTKDYSFSIHRCCSYLQEIRVLYEYIINILNINQKLKLNDILITATNIKPYILYINRIFEPLLKNNRIIYNSNKKNTIKKNIILTIKNLFKIKNNRFQCSWILSLLNSKFLRKKFFIKSSDIKIIYTFISDLKIQFEFDKHQFKKMSIPNIHTYSWNYAIDRITSGYWLNKTYSIWNNISVYSVSYKKGNLLLGNFINLIVTLNKFRKKILNKKLLKNWLNIIPQIFNDFFDIPLKYKKIFFMLEKIWKKIVSDGIIMQFSKKISISILIKKFFKNNFSLFDDETFMSGSINIAKLKNIRIIPFKMICVLGCVQGKIPKIEKTDILNIIYPNIYQKNKNIFFETIMSSQKYFFCSYTQNKTEKKNNYASQYIIDIISYIKKNFYIKYKQIFKKNVNIINNIHFKYNDQLYNSYFIYKNIEKFSNNKKNIKKKNHIIIKKNILIKKLIKFWQNPIHYFFKKKLRIHYIRDNIESIHEHELFSIHPIYKYHFNKKILKYRILKKKTNLLFKKFQLQNKIPYGHLGTILWKIEEKKIQKLVNKINIIKNYSKKIDVNLKIKKYFLSGKIKEINKSGLIRWSANKIGYKNIISTWIEHIIYCTLEPYKKSTLLGTNKSIIEFYPIKKKQAKKYLKQYIQGYLDGTKKPILILKSGMIWLQSIYLKKLNILKKDNKSHYIAKKNFLKTWNGNSFYNGEKNNIYIKKIIPYMDIIKMNKICNTCTYWLLPILKNSNIKKYHFK
nr:exodeoxyribonuclease V subunit gamma [Buchnera aphidicola]